MEFDTLAKLSLTLIVAPALRLLLLPTITGELFKVVFYRMLLVIEESGPSLFCGYCLNTPFGLEHNPQS